MQKTATLTGVLVGLFGGLALYRIAFMLGDFEVVSRSSLEQQQRRIAALEQDNLELADELFQPRASLYGAIDDGDLPYDGDDDASDEVAAARAAALMDKEFLMKFGVGVKCQSKPDKVSFWPIPPIRLDKSRGTA